jgi:hypothetical protein
MTQQGRNIRLARLAEEKNNISPKVGKKRAQDNLAAALGLKSIDARPCQANIAKKAKPSDTDTRDLSLFTVGSSRNELAELAMEEAAASDKAEENRRALVRRTLAAEGNLFYFFLSYFVYHAIPQPPPPPVSTQIMQEIKY